MVGWHMLFISPGVLNGSRRVFADELAPFPGVRAAAVIGMPDAARGELPVAFVEADSRFEAEALLADLREKLASFKVPKTVCVLQALPRNAMGKIEKTRLRELFVANK